MSFGSAVAIWPIGDDPFGRNAGRDGDLFHSFGNRLLILGF